MAAATGSVNGYLTSTDWTTFNGKQATLVSGTNIKTVSGTSLLGSGDLGLIGATYGGTGVNNGSNTITLGGNLTYSGAYTQTWTRTANTSLTLPASGTVLSSTTATANNPITGTPSSSNYLRGDGTWASVASSNITSLGLYENSATIGADYTIGTGNNAMSAGPITISTGFTVTVPTGSTWVIV
jgi:hypothetical protein